MNRVISRRSSINIPSSPSLDITNVGIIFYNSNNILLVNDVSGQWTIPFGRKKIDESNNSAALRIFKTRTGSDIDETMIISVNKNIRIHRNGNNSVIYTIISNQSIPTISSNITTIPLDSLENLVRFNRPYGVVKDIVDFNRTLFNGLNFF
jgi:ADP-ribose pyrophosphatase YjhB (NUDIX family)